MDTQKNQDRAAQLSLLQARLTAVISGYRELQEQKKVFNQAQPLLQKIEALHNNTSQNAEFTKRVSQWQELSKKYSFLDAMLSDQQKQILLSGEASTKTIQTVDDLINAYNNYQTLRNTTHRDDYDNFGLDMNVTVRYSDADLDRIENAFDRIRTAAQNIINNADFLPNVENAVLQEAIRSTITNLNGGGMVFLNLFNPQRSRGSVCARIKRCLRLHRSLSAEYPLRWDSEVLPRTKSLDTTQEDADLVARWRGQISQITFAARDTDGVLNSTFWSPWSMRIAEAARAVAVALERSDEKRADLQTPQLEPETEVPNPTNPPNLTNFTRLPLTSQGISAADVRQGDINDCTVISSLAGLAANNSQSLLQTQDGRDRFTLTSEHGQPAVYSVIVYCRNPQSLAIEERSVSVTTNFYTNMQGNPIYANNGNRAAPTELWAMLYEKALAQVRGGYDGLNDSDPGEIAAMLTGVASTTTNIPPPLSAEDRTDPNNVQSDTESENQIINILSSSFAITMLCSRSDARTRGRANISNSHAYRLVSFNNNLITLQDPTGTNNVTDMTIADLRIYFKSIVTNTPQ